MNPPNRHRLHPSRVASATCVALALCAATSVAWAQRVPIRRYDVRDGLAHSRVTSILQDRWGYLWFATWEGLSRFDGYRFRNYGPAEGLDPPVIFDVAEDRRGRIWAATWGGGVACLSDRLEGGSTAGKAFALHRVGSTRESNLVQRIFFDGRGRLWVVTSAGVFTAEGSDADSLSFTPAIPDSTVEASRCDARGRIWIGAAGELRRISDGGTYRYPLPRGTPPGDIVDIIEDGADRLLVATEQALLAFRPPADPAGPGLWENVPLRLGPDQPILSILRDAGGIVWIGTRRGLIRYEGGKQSAYTTAHGLSDDYIRTLHEDREGNLWIGTNEVGVCEYSGERIVSYLPAGDGDGAGPSRNIVKIVQDADGRIYGTADHPGLVEIEGGRLAPVPGSDRSPFLFLSYCVVADHRQDWWVGTVEGLYRFRGPRLELRHGRRMTSHDGIPEREIVGLYFDPRARRLWVGTDENDVLYTCDLSRTDRPRFEAVPLGSASQMRGLREMRSDRSGTLWVSGFVGLGRLRQGRFTPLASGRGLPNTEARVLFEDSRGWLWLGHRIGGVSVTKNPEAEHPDFANYSTRDGLASDTVWSIAEDDAGRIYLGTGRGLDRLDPSTGEIRHFGMIDGLAGETVSHCYRDPQGMIWLATSNGISRFDPRYEPAAAPPLPVYITRLTIAGEELSLPEHGASALSGLRLGPSSDNLLIEFVGLSYRSENRPRYAYRLEGAGSGWTSPSDQRTVNFAHLAPGTYRFIVRATHPGGGPSADPASIEFRILPPVWQRAWFVGLATLLVGLAAVSFHRLRLRRAVEMERIRRQIAIDLHDDVGSGLSEIAILSEVAKRGASQPAVSLLDQTAELARSMRESMSDIVWAIDPRKDHLSDLVHRMRQASFNLLESRGVRVDFRASGERELERFNLAPDRRRHILLIFKEAIANVARHARATRVEVSIETGPGEFRLSIRDDGCGFDPESPYDGNGLKSLRQRAVELGAGIEIASTPGGGASVRLLLPLRKRWALRRS